MTAQEFYDNKTPRPSEMTTRQWDGVSLEVRERSFFMAAVAKAEVLQVYQDVTRRVISGELSEAEARRALREGLAAVNYLPRPGEEGSIKDLSTVRRMNITLRTNRAMAYNKTAYDKQLLAIKVFPAKRMVRLQQKRVPRDWQARWRQLDGQPGVNAKEMAALITSPVWVQLSRFGAPYPPYDFGSGMGDQVIRRDEAEQLGLLEAPTLGAPSVPAAPENKTSAPAGGLRIEDGQAVVTPSLNANLEATPRLSSPALKRRLTDDLRGLAKYDGDTLIFTDPNGTRPVRPADLAATISTPNAARIPLLQADVLRQWAAEGPASMTAGSDALYHFRRLVRRVLPLTANEPLELARDSPSTEERDALLTTLENGTLWVPRAATFPFSAFAKGNADAPGPPGRTALPARIILSVIRHSTARDLTPAVAELADRDAHGHHVLFERGAAFRVLTRATREDGSVVVTLSEEVPP